MSDLIWFFVGAAVGGLFSEIIFRPFVELRRLRTDIVATLKEYSGYFITLPQTIPPERRQQASDVIYRQASRVGPLVDDAPMYAFFRHLFRLPPKDNFGKILPLLTRLSNFYANRNPTELMLASHCRQEVCELLERPLPSNERLDPADKSRLLKILGEG